jgi:hypothetical protein
MLQQMQQAGNQPIGQQPIQGSIGVPPQAAGQMQPQMQQAQMQQQQMMRQQQMRQQQMTMQAQQAPQQAQQQQQQQQQQQPLPLQQGSQYSNILPQQMPQTSAGATFAKLCLFFKF